MKYIMVIPDGLTDVFPPREGKESPLDKAEIPHIDYLLQNGLTGVMNTIPEHMAPGSDVANLSLLGVDPTQIEMGRGALEALAQDIKLQSDQTAFRANLVTITNNIMADYTGGEIQTKDAAELIHLLNNVDSVEKEKIFDILSKRQPYTVELKKILKKNGSYKYCRNVIENYREEAIKNLEPIPGSEYKDALIKLANSLSNRIK